MTDPCRWCRSVVPSGKRRDAVFCSQRCRQAHWRFARAIERRQQADSPMRLAYADPPYPGLAHYYRDHPDYDGEVDMPELLSRLQDYDGWAISTNERSLAALLDACRDGLEVTPRVAAWFRGSRNSRSAWPLSAWEPVVFAGGRRVVSSRPGEDALVHVSRPRTTDPQRVIGAKPAAFASWLFGLLGALPGDTLDDLYPGSGGIGRAWEIYSSAPARRDASGGDDVDASRLEHGDASSEYSRDTSPRCLQDVSPSRSLRVAQDLHDGSGLSG